MQFDLIFVVGLIVAAFSIPAIVSAFSDRRAPRGGAVALALGAALVAYANYLRPDTYTIQTIPDVFVRVMAYYLN